MCFIHRIALLAFCFVVATASSCACGPQPLGASCDAAAEEPCVDGSVCVAVGDEHQCRVAPGDPCDAASEEPYCVEGAACLEIGSAAECRLQERSSCDAAAPHCAPGLVCEEVEGGDAPYACHGALYFQGRVLDAANEEGIEGAHVLALDEQSSPVTDVAVSDADGRYGMQVPVKRKADGTPVAADFTLRAAAQDYQPFPGGVRSALPINVALAVKGESGWALEGALTDIALIPLPEEERGRARVEGVVRAGERSRGVLVVLEEEQVGYTGVSDAGGRFVIFNVPPGDYVARGYRVGVQLEPVRLEVDADDVAGVELEEVGGRLATVTGTIQGVAGVSNRPTSVVLVVEKTFLEATERGEVPMGLRTARDVTGSWTIEGVPDGRYVVLAAYENDELVRDPDFGTSGTDLVFIDVANGADVAAGAFKITVAIAIVSPGAEQPEAVSAAPTFRWVDESGERYYTLDVYDSFGEVVWQSEVPSVSGGDVSFAYAGPPLEDGLYYQFRVTSWRQPSGVDTPTSRTEDLRGVFYLAE